jgi:hypothetical protein
MAEKSKHVFFKKSVCRKVKTVYVVTSKRTSALVDMANVTDVWVTVCDEHVGTLLLVVYDTPRAGGSVVMVTMT